MVRFEKGEYIVYGVTGVCRVRDISHIELGEASKERLYYNLQPVHARDEKIYTPVDNQKITMRRVLTRQEAFDLIEQIPSIEELWADNEKQREERYKAAMKSCDCREWVKVIKTLYLRKQERISQGKKLTSVDERYFNKAKENLYSELAVSFGIQEEQVERYIVDKLDGQA